VAGLSAPRALDGIEIRMVCGSAEAPNGSTEVLAGEGCASDACEQELATLDARFLGWDRSVQLRCHSYVAAYQAGSVAGSATNEVELVQLLGALDTPTEVQLLTTLKGLTCVRIAPAAGAFEALVGQMINTCPVTHQEVRYAVGADGAMRELGRGATSETGVCIGRKPDGLLGRATNATPGSELGEHLARVAELEAASVVAFVALRAELRAHGAPPRLLRRLAVAASDEVRHARSMTALACRFGAAPGPRRVRVAAVRPLEAIALDNLAEGCINETWGALVGAHQARRARDAGARQAYAAVSRDELRHAALSWDLHDWLQCRLSPGARRRLRAAAQAQIAKLEASLGSTSSPTLQRELGLPSASVERVLFESLRRGPWSERLTSPSRGSRKRQPRASV
jgi:hypothetical protein